MKFIFPTSNDDFIARDLLITEALRPSGLPFDIKSEYPIVLNKDNPNYSYCMINNNDLVAHANLWPRKFKSSHFLESYRVGLIGNVATHKKCQGQGFMRHLFNHLESECKKFDLEAIILWSDLVKFYHKLGFMSLGSEFRFLFDINQLSPQGPMVFSAVDPTTLNNQDLTELFTIRYPTNFTLERSEREFFDLLKIPAMNLFVAFENNQLKAYLIIGKGYDMMGVIHEWGAKDAGTLLAGIASIGQCLKLNELLLLTPATLQESWYDILLANAKAKTTHSMALIKNLTGNNHIIKSLAGAFIWGLDSI